MTWQYPTLILASSVVRVTLHTVLYRHVGWGQTRSIDTVASLTTTPQPSQSLLEINLLYTNELSPKLNHPYIRKAEVPNNTNKSNSYTINSTLIRDQVVRASVSAGIHNIETDSTTTLNSVM